MKTKKWLKCLLMTMALMMAVNVGITATAIPATAKAKTETVKKGTKFWKGNLQYKVSSLKGKKGTATLIGAKSKVTSVSVPKTVKTGKYTLTVTAIGDNAFKGCKKLKKVATNTVIKEIGKNAFKGCKKLETVDIRSKSLKSVGKNALKGIAKTAVVKVPEGKDASYEKLLKVPVQTPAEEKATEAVKEAEAPKTPATEAPKAVSTPAETKTETPKAAETPEATLAPAGTKTETPNAAETPEATPTPEETELESLKETEMEIPEATPTPEEPEMKAQKATETETQKATEAETQKVTEAETQKATEAKTQKVTETETQKATETETQKATEKVTEAETQKATETEAPKAPETTPTPAPTPSPEVESEAPAPKPSVKRAPSVSRKQASTSEPKAEQTETEAATAPKETETKAPAVTPAPETEAPVQTEAKKEETEAPAQTEAKKEETEAPAQTETEAPTETEHVCEFTWVVTKEPYCGYLGYDMTWRDTGSRTGTCEVCGKTVKEGLRAEHDFEDSYVAPTCTMDGYYKCKVCGYKDTENAGKALGHDMQHFEVAPTCTEDGYSYDQCSRCGKIANKTVTAKKLGHDYSGEVTVLKEATCMADGQQLTACAHEGCTATWSKRIPRLGHEFLKEEFPATCTEDAKTVTTCKNCDYKDVKVDYGTAHHTLVEEGQVATYGARSAFRVKACIAEGCDYTEVDEVDQTSHSSHTHWVDVDTLKKELEEKGEETTKLPLAQGVLAANSVINGQKRIRTEICKDCFDLPERKYELRYTYQENGTGDWISWEQTSCYKNGKGHTWDESLKGKDGKSTLCRVCGMTKPAEQGLGSSLVWDASFTADSEKCVGFKLPNGGVYATALLTSKASYPLKVTAPEAKPGYEFQKWTWKTADNQEHSSEDPELTVPCDLMNVVFTAHYAQEGQTESAMELEADELAAASVPQSIHEELHVDLAGVLDADLSTAGHEEHTVTDHSDPLVESEDTAALEAGLTG